MPPESSEAPSPASQKGDAESGNLSSGQAAAQLFASSQRQVKAEAPVAEEVATEAVEAEETQEPAADTEAETVESSTEESETATDEVAEDEAPEEEDEALSQRTSEERAKAKEAIQKRINKEVAKTKAMERRVAELEAALREREAAPPVEPAATNQATDLPTDIAKLNDLNSLNAYKQNALKARRWAEQALEAEAEGDPLPEAKDYDRKQLREIKRNAQLALEDFIPQREAFVRARVQNSQAAVKEFPFLADKASPEYAMAQNARRSYPWLGNLPNADWIIGVQILGIKAYEAQKAEAAKPAAVAKPKAPVAKPSSDQTAVSSTGTAARVLPASANRQALAAEQKKFEDKGGVTASEAAAFLQRKTQLRATR